jgi:hypothetical protein
MKKNRLLTVATVILVLAISNFFRIKGHENIRTVEFLSILAIGMILGVILRELFGRMRS